MKRLLYIFFMLNTFCYLSAQDSNNPYIPMLQEGKTWTAENGENIFSHRIEGDTIIIGESWKKVYTNCNQDNYYYIAAIREDNNKIYLITSGTETVLLLYDFNMKIGDEAYCNSDEKNSIYYLIDSETIIINSMVLQQIDTVEVNGYNLRRFIFESRYLDKAPASNKQAQSFEYPYLVWIEGVGSEGGLLCSWYSHRYEINVSLNNNIIFQDDDFHKTSNQANDIEIIINSTAEHLDLEAPMYNVLGMPVNNDYHGIVIQHGKKYVK